VRALAILLLLSTGRTSVPPQAHDRVAIRRVVRKHLQQIVACFEPDGMPMPKVDVTFTIGASGTVTSMKTTSTGSQRLQRCVASVFAKMTFPPRTTPLRVSYPVRICAAGQ